MQYFKYRHICKQAFISHILDFHAAPRGLIQYSYLMNMQYFNC